MLSVLSVITTIIRLNNEKVTIYKYNYKYTKCLILKYISKLVNNLMKCSNLIHIRKAEPNDIAFISDVWLETDEIYSEIMPSAFYKVI